VLAVSAELFDNPMSNDVELFAIRKDKGVGRDPERPTRVAE
jgi:hypothetical protein